MPRNLRHSDASALYDVKRLNQMLLGRFGSMVAAWRGIFDLKGYGRIGLADFLSSCATLQFPGDARAVFDALASKRHIVDKHGKRHRCVTLHAFDQEAAAL